MAVADVTKKQLNQLYRYRKNPVSWCRDFLGSNFWPKQEEIIKSVFEHRFTFVKSCNGVGKTFTAANAALSFLYLYDSKVVTTATNWSQVGELWGEIRHAHIGSRVALPGQLNELGIKLSRAIQGRNPDTGEVEDV